jgi:hypothetical protein
MSEEATEPGPSEEGNVFISLASSLAVLGLVAFLTNKLKQKHEFIWHIHLKYWFVAILVTIFLPYSISKYVFSELTVGLVGCLFPVYESVYAVCTPGEFLAYNKTAFSIYSTC